MFVGPRRVADEEYDEGIVREGRPATAAVAAGAPLRVTLEGAHRRTLA